VAKKPIEPAIQVVDERSRGGRSSGDVLQKVGRPKTLPQSVNAVFEPGAELLEIPAFDVRGQWPNLTVGCFHELGRV
jgi:hypothetical protein